MFCLTCLPDVIKLEEVLDTFAEDLVLFENGLVSYYGPTKSLVCFVGGLLLQSSMLLIGREGRMFR